MSGFVYNGTRYDYKYSENLIVGILYNDEEVARYTYDYKTNVDVQECVDGEWCANTSETFIGNINKIRYKGYYYDIETGWYYNGRYIDSIGNRFIDGMSQYAVSRMIDQYGAEYEAEILLASNYYGLDLSDGMATNSLARSGSYSEVEVIARVIYAESNVDLTDQGGVAWVIYNRRIALGKTAYQIVTATGQFTAYGSYCYYNPDTSKASWAFATTHASLLSRGYKPNVTPSGFSNQRNFRAILTFQKGLSFSGGQLYYKGERIYDVYIVGYGKLDYTDFNFLKSTDFSDMEGKYNVFFKYSDE